LIRITTLVGLIVLYGSAASAQDTAPDTRPGVAPDIREDESRLKLQRGDFVVVPIPISNPTLEEGLVAGAAYFYPQSEEEDSRAFALVQQNYWKNNKWRFTGAVGGADLRLSLLAPSESNAGTSVDWRINGKFLFAKVAKKLKGNWYGGVLTRLIDANQSIDLDVATSGFDIGSDVASVGLGALFEYDTRDNPFNSSGGRHFKFDALFNDEAIGSNKTYQSYSVAYRSYHRLSCMHSQAARLFGDRLPRQGIGLRSS
jgi:hypothetical protein